MTFCFICKVKLDSECTRVCTSIAPHSNTPYPEIIAYMLGEEYVVIVTPADQVCKKCSSLINHMDKCENDARLIRNALVLNIHKQYGVVAPDKAVKNVEVGHLMTEERKEQSLRKEPNSLPIEVAHTATTNSVITPIPTPLKLSKTQQQPHQQENIKKVKVFKCRFCSFQSRELGYVRFHMHTHAKRIEAEKPSVEKPVVEKPVVEKPIVEKPVVEKPIVEKPIIEKPIVEKPIVDQAAATTLTPVPQKKKQLYRCQVCSLSFDSQTNCSDHIQKHHNRPTRSTLKRARETENSCSITTQGMTPEPSNIQENNQLAQTPMNIDKNQQYKDSGTVDMDMMLNDNIPTEGHGNVKEEKKTENAVDEEETKNSQEDTNLGKEPESAREEETESGGKDKKDTAMPEQADHKTSHARRVYREGSLDIESMLAAIHGYSSPTNSGDTQSHA